MELKSYENVVCEIGSHCVYNSFLNINWVVNNIKYETTEYVIINYIVMLWGNIKGRLKKYSFWGKQQLDFYVLVISEHFKMHKECQKCIIFIFIVVLLLLLKLNIFFHELKCNCFMLILCMIVINLKMIFISCITHYLQICIIFFVCIINYNALRSRLTQIVYCMYQMTY